MIQFLLLQFLLERKKHSLQFLSRSVCFFRACRLGRLEVIRFLTKEGATLDGMDKGNLTPLLCAVSNGQDHAIDFLLDNGANIKITGPSDKSVLHLALEKNHNITLELLIQKGTKELLNWMDKDYQTPLHYAASLGNKQVRFYFT